jgi:hypothetical protein
LEPFVKVSRELCWWCQMRPADSREHKIKRTDLVRVHGRGELRGSRTLVVRSGERSTEHRSTKNDALKFSPSMCAYCNNTRSQPFDRAYDEFIEWVLANDATVLAERRIDLTAVFAFDENGKAEDVLRFFVKHVCCRLAETVNSDGDTLIPSDAVSFLCGGRPPKSIATAMWIEPSWLRFDRLGAGDPNWISILGMEPVEAGPEMRVASRWNYGWLVLGWECWGREEGNAFLDREIALPILCAKPAVFELSYVATTAARHEGGADDQNWLQRVRGGIPVDPDALANSAVAEKFIAGALDSEAAAREEVPDHRQFLLARPFADAGLEVMRAGWLCGVARSVWARGSLDPGAVREVELTENLLDPQLLHREAVALGVAEADSGWSGVSRGFAAMASLKLAEAYEHGVEAEKGEEALFAAASLSGASVAAAGALAEDWPAAWDSVHAALAMLAALGVEVTAIAS